MALPENLLLTTEYIKFLDDLCFKYENNIICDVEFFMRVDEKEDLVCQHYSWGQPVQHDKTKNY